MAREKGEVVPVAVQISGKTKAIMAILAAVVLLSVCGIGGFLYWNSLPPQQFENWPRTYSSSARRRFRRWKRNLTKENFEGRGRYLDGLFDHAFEFKLLAL